MTTATKTTTARKQEVSGYAPPPLPRSWTTAEFWFSVLTTLVSLLTGLNIVHPGFDQAHKEQIEHIAWVAAIVVPSAYSFGRAHLKAAHQAAVASVLTAAIHEGVTLERLLPTKARPAGDTGAGELGLLVWAAGAILAGIGAVWLIVAAIHHHLSVDGLVLLIIGVVLIICGDRLGARRRL